MSSVSRRAAWLVPLGVAAYLARFASSWLVSRTAATRFDPHGFGLLGDVVLLSALALPMLGLLWWVVRRNRPWRGLLAAASGPGWTAGSWLLLLLLGAPLPGQLWAVALLPVPDAWPVWIACLSWFAVAVAGRALAVASPRHCGNGPLTTPAS